MEKTNKAFKNDVSIRRQLCKNPDRNEIEEESSRVVSLKAGVYRHDLRCAYGRVEDDVWPSAKQNNNPDEIRSAYLEERDDVHDKVIMSNRVPIAADEIIEHVMDGISDNVLRNQSHIQRFTQIKSLLEAFEMALQDHLTTASNRPMWNNKSAVRAKECDQ